jgi:tetratricopeptide (TPR) repeat protein
MLLPDTFDDAKRHYFGLGRKRDRDRGEQLLHALWETSEDKLIKAKVAYFLGAIHLTDLIRASLQVTTNTDTLTEPQKKILTTGLEWLKKSHALGYETASLLLARMHGAPNQYEFDAIQIGVDGTVFTSRPVYAKELFSLVYVANFLEPISKTNQLAALHLGNYGREWLKLIESLINSDSVVYETDQHKIAQIVHQSLSVQPAEQEYYQIFSKFIATLEKEVGDVTEITSETDLDFMRDEVDDFITATEEFSTRGVLAAIELMRDVFSGKWLLCRLVDERFAQNVDRVKQLQQLIWEKRLEKGVIALNWLENSKNLGCPNYPSYARLQLFYSSQIYVINRRNGRTHEEAKEEYDFVVKDLKIRKTAETIGRLNITFFETPHAIYQQGQSLLEKSEFEGATIYFRKALGSLTNKNGDPEKIGDCNYMLARCSLQTHDFDNAVVHCDQALKIFKNLHLTQKYKAVIKLYKQCLEAAIPMIQKIFVVAAKLIAAKNYDKAKIFLKYVLTHSHDLDTLKYATLDLDLCRDHLLEEKSHTPSG